MNFKKWFDESIFATWQTQSVTSLSVADLPSLKGKPFFIFDTGGPNGHQPGLPVMRIDFDLGGMFRAVSHFNERWYALIPKKIRDYDIGFTGGRHIVVNHHCEEQNGSPCVYLAHDLGKAIQKQLEKEIWQEKVKQQQHVVPHLVQQEVDKELASNTRQYFRLPSNWLNFTKIYVGNELKEIDL